LGNRGCAEDKEEESKGGQEVIMFSTKIMFALMLALLVGIGTYLIYEYRMPKFIAYATGPEWDCDEDFIDIPGACLCWNEGYTADRFNQSRSDECANKGNQYFAGFTAANRSQNDLNGQRVTVDDGYTYPANVTEEVDKKRIDALELEEWKKAGMPQINDQFLGLFNDITSKTLLNFTLVTHEDQSITLYAFLPNATIGADSLPDAMRPIISYSNSNALVGPNGVEEVLTKLAKSWHINEIKEWLASND
jgi:hypothetical protein